MQSEQELRQKYRETLHQLESQQAQAARLEDALKLLIGRLCLAGRGRHQHLDEQLQRVGRAARSKLEAAEISAMIEPLSRAIAVLDQIGADTIQLLRPAAFESAPGSAPESATSAPAPGATPTSAAGSAPASASASAPESAAASTPAPAPGAAPSAGPASNAPADSPDARAQRVHAALTSMLERLSALPELRPAIAALDDPASNELSAEELADRLERVTSLMGAQRAALLREKAQIEDMLRQMDSRLEAISAFFALEDADHSSTRDSSTKLNKLVIGEVREISDEVHGAASLTELRGRVGMRLEAINGHLAEFRQREEARLTAQADRTVGLRARVEELERESRVLQQNLQKEQRAASVDALTGIPNRAAYDERIAQEYERWQRYGGTISLLTWDVDHFKGINDDFGHKAGDKVLRVIGQHLSHSVRGTDFVARYGGEEFIMILRDIAPDQALKTADKIRAGIQSIAFHFRDAPVTVTVSCGVTTFRMGDTADLAFERADGALYEAKAAGRNCCMAR